MYSAKCICRHGFYRVNRFSSVDVIEYTYVTSSKFKIKYNLGEYAYQITPA